MNRSFTRGLAASAVTALTATGLSMATAPAAQAAAPEVELISQFTGVASMAFDNSTSSARLVAHVDDPASADVTFQLNPDPEAGAGDDGWREIGPATEVREGLALLDWYGIDATGRSWTGERVALRVTATNVDGSTSDVRNNIELTGSGDDGVSISNYSERYFVQPYADAGRTAATATIQGVTSAPSGTVALSSWRSSDGTFTARTVAEIESVSTKLPGSGYEYIDTGRFEAEIELTDAEREAGSIVLAAERGSDDVQPVALFPQTITTIAAYADGAPTGQSSAVTIQVYDEIGAAVQGAEIRRHSDDTVVGYSDHLGLVRTTQESGSTEEYYANATDADAFSAEDGDVQSGPVTGEAYEPVASWHDAILGDGTAFDVDEYAAGDLAVLVYDERGRTMVAGESVSYKIYPSEEEAPAEWSTALTDDDGVAVLDFDPTGASGRYTIASVLTRDVETTTPQQRTFTTGQAAMLLSPKASPVVADAGGQVDYLGRLVVEGEPLAGRQVDLTYTRGVEAVPGNGADAGLVTPDGLALATTRTTNGNGSFRVTVDDLDEATLASEFGGVLAAETVVTEATDSSTIAGDAGTGATSGTVFGTAEPGVAKVRAGGVGNGRAADRLRVTGPATLAGENVEVFRMKANGKRVRVATRTLNQDGDKPSIRVADTNGRQVTTYVVRLVGSDRVAAYETEGLDLR